ncbi:MAG: restriction endonuclease subunit S [Flavipsychrobacter sp.]|nr:restriction endonuclease subunit S [Flavipsychrobacter sp.]
MSVDLKFIPLTFITSNEEILKQIKNTVLFSYLLNKNEETSLNYYLETTQYGFTASALEAGSHKLVRITDINNGKVDWNTVPFCNCSDDRKYLLRDHDILVARTGGTTGKSFIVSNPPENAVFASYLIRLRLNKNADLDFITCFLNSYLFWSQIIEMKSGSAMPNVNAEKLKTLKLPKCDVKTQREIVQAFQHEKNKNGLNGLYQRVNSIEMLFKDTNELSSNLSYQQDLLTQFRQSILQEAMQGKLVKQDPKDGHAKELLEKIKAEKAKSGRKEKELPPIKPDEIPFEIPENWVWCRLGEIAYIASGSTPKQDAFVSSGVPYFKMYNLKNQKIDFHHKPQYIKREIHEGQLKRSRAFPGDILMNIVGPPLGKLAIITEEFPESNFNQAAVLIRPFVKSINRWIFWYLNEMSEINSIVTKGVAGQDNISVTQSNNIKVTLPSLPELNRIVKKIEELMKICDELQESIHTSREQNELLLQQVLKEALKLNK